MAADGAKTWRELGLTDFEYNEIVKILGREPNLVELGMYSVMWSEHCGYKNSRPVLARFPTKGPRVIQGPGENAGVVDIGDGLAIVMKIESHNHPSAIEPYQGAATGVGGILRDIFTMGARPIAILDSLRFGPPDQERVKFLMDGVVAGIAGYGNCVGVPTVAGEVYFEDCYRDNPLVNAMCVGLAEKDKIAYARAEGVGCSVMVVGSRTGRDGICGASFASAELNEKSEERRPAVQVGDPFTEKLLIEACLEAIATGDLVGIQDMGAAGLTCSSCEMASRGGSGMDIDIALVPRREEGITPYEMMLSESQERMLVVPKKGKEDEIKKIFHKWGLTATVVGRVTDDGILRIREGDKVVAEVPSSSLTDAPTYHPDQRIPEYLAEMRAFDTAQLAPPPDLNDVMLKLIGSFNIASRAWVFEQYDYTVQTNTVVVPGSDAAVLRIKGTRKAIALTCDANGRYCYLDPFVGAGIAVAEAARNLACVGAAPLAITDCLNFGTPEKSEIFWQFARCVEGMAHACRVLDTPVVGGNVSFYNETEGVPIYPTPVVGMVGLIEDVQAHSTLGFKDERDVIILLGETRPELGGSEYLKVIEGVVAGTPPALDLGHEKNLIALCIQAIRTGLVKSAHDLSEGGLAVALAECCFPRGLGADVTLDSGLKDHEVLFSESQGRVILTTSEANVAELLALAKDRGIPAAVIGKVGGGNLVIRKGDARSGKPRALVNLSVAALEARWRECLPALMGPAGGSVSGSVGGSMDRSGDHSN